MLLLQELQCFSHSIERGDSAQRWCCLSRKTLRGGQYSFKEKTGFTLLTKLLDSLVLTLRILLQQLQFFSHSLVWGDFALRWFSSPLETLRGGEYSLKQHTQFTILNMLLNNLASNTYDFLRRIPVFLHSLERCYLNKVDVSYPWKPWQVGSVSFKC
jgi:hypothetical protein